MENKNKKYILLAGIVTIVVILDQWTKSLVRNHLTLGETWMPWEWLAPYARIVHWQNNGVVFGLFQGHPEIFTVLTSVIAVIILIYFRRIPAEERALQIALSMQLGGAIGNLIDRLLFNGHVTDLISVGTFPVFNIADSSVTLGVAALLIGLYLEEKNLKQPADSARQDDNHNNRTESDDNDHADTAFPPAQS